MPTLWRESPFGLNQLHNHTLAIDLHLTCFMFIRWLNQLRETCFIFLVVFIY